MCAKSILKKIAAISILSLFLAPTAFAEVSPDFALYPGSTDSNTRFQYLINAGGEIRDSVKLENKSEQAITLRIDALDAFDDNGNKMIDIDPSLFDREINKDLPKVIFSGENMHMLLPRNGSFIVSNPDAAKEFAGKWVTLEESTVKLNPGETKMVNFKVQIPKEAKEFTTYTGGLLVRYIGESATEAGYGVNISTGIAERLYFDVLPKDVIALYLPGDKNFLLENLEYVLGGAAILLILGFCFLGRESSNGKKK